MIIVEHALMDEAGDSVRLAVRLASGEDRVVLAGPRAASLRELQLLEQAGVERAAELLEVSGATTALLDVWTNECDERVVALRARGVQTSCLADLLLASKTCVGITGTAGKTTTSHLTCQLLGALLGEKVWSSQARAANLWPQSELLAAPAGAPVVVELTSSHLAFCQHSPRVAAITNFWADHVELHGSYAAYRAAKERLFSGQGAEDIAVLPADAPEAAAMAGPLARRAWFWQGSRVGSEGEIQAPLDGRGGEISVWSEDGWLGISSGAEEPLKIALDTLPEWAQRGVRQRSLLCALATSLAAARCLRGVCGSVGAMVAAIGTLRLPPHRCRAIKVGSATVFDDTLAATPRKAAAHLTPGIHLVAGGMRKVGGRAVHDSAAERFELENWLIRIEACCTSVDVFGDAGEWLAERLSVRKHGSVLEALESALAGGANVLVAPGFPMSQSDREAVANFGCQDPPPRAENPA